MHNWILELRTKKYRKTPNAGSDFRIQLSNVKQNAKGIRKEKNTENCKYRMWHIRFQALFFVHMRRDFCALK
jgi:hypothetical protein